MDRRNALVSLTRAALLAHPAARLLFRTGRSLPEDFQALVAQVRRVAQAMTQLGEPFGAAELNRIESAAAMRDAEKGIAALRRVLDDRCLLVVNVNPEARVAIARGAAPPSLVEQGWRSFLPRA